jgi:hypothetical protein
MVHHGPGVSARIVEDGRDKSCVHAALYKNRLFVAAIYRYRTTSVWVKAHAPYKDTDRDCVLPRVPARMKNLLVEVQWLELHGILRPWLDTILSSQLLVTCQRTANFLRLECRLVRLQHNIIQCLHVKDAQVIVVGTG